MNDLDALRHHAQARRALARAAQRAPLPPPRTAVTYALPLVLVGVAAWLVGLRLAWRWLG